MHRCHHALPWGPRWSRPLGAPTLTIQGPTFRSTIETFPKRAIYLFPINRSAVIKKSMWPGWASLSLSGKGAFEHTRRTAQGWRRSRNTCQDNVNRALGTWAPWPGQVAFPQPASGGTGETRSGPFPFLSSVPGSWGCSHPPPHPGRRAAPRLLLLLRRLNRDFVKRDR